MMYLPTLEVPKYLHSPLTILACASVPPHQPPTILDSRYCPQFHVHRHPTYFYFWVHASTLLLPTVNELTSLLALRPLSLLFIL